MRKKVIYIAGPIAGTDDYEERFAEAEKELVKSDRVVFNPVRMLSGLDDRECLPVCLQLVELADIILLLPGWSRSLGALTEIFYAIRQGKHAFLYEGNRSAQELKWDEEAGAFYYGARAEL